MWPAGRGLLTPGLNDVFDRARILEDARRNASSYKAVQSSRFAENTIALRANKYEKVTEEEQLTNAENCLVLKQALTSWSSKRPGPGFFCGDTSHKRVI